MLGYTTAKMDARASRRRLLRCSAALRLQGRIGDFRNQQSSAAQACPPQSPGQTTEHRQSLSTERPQSIMDQASLVDRVANRSSDWWSSSPRFVVSSCLSLTSTRSLAEPFHVDTARSCSLAAFPIQPLNLPTFFGLQKINIFLITAKNVPSQADTRKYTILQIANNCRFKNSSQCFTDVWYLAVVLAPITSPSQLRTSLKHVQPRVSARGKMWATLVRSTRRSSTRVAQGDPQNKALNYFKRCRCSRPAYIRQRT